MKIIVADRKEYIEYFSKKQENLKTEELDKQTDYIIHRIEFDGDIEDSFLVQWKINNLLREQYNNNSYISLAEIKEITEMLLELEEEQLKIVNAFLEIKEQDIQSINEIKRLILDIDNYQILETYNLKEVGELIVEKVSEYEVSKEMKPFINYSALAKEYLFKSNIREDFCSYGLLVHTKNMMDNELVEEKLTEDKVLKIVVVNKKEFEKYRLCRHVTICLPTDEYTLKKKLAQIGVEYENISLNDTHVRDCQLVNFKNEELADRFTYIVENFIGDSVKKDNIAIPLQEIEQLCKAVQNYDQLTMNKFLALAQIKEDKINKFSDLIELANKAESYEILTNVKSLEDMGKYLLKEIAKFWDIDIVSDFIDYEKYAKHYTKKGQAYAGEITEFGYLLDKEEREEELE